MRVDQKKVKMVNFNLFLFASFGLLAGQVETCSSIFIHIMMRDFSTLFSFHFLRNVTFPVLCIAIRSHRPSKAEKRVVWTSASTFNNTFFFIYNVIQMQYLIHTYLYFHCIWTLASLHFHSNHRKPYTGCIEIFNARGPTSIRDRYHIIPICTQC